MKTIQEWAEYYYEKGLLLWMPINNQPLTEWSKSFKQSIENINEYNWDCVSNIMGIAGSNDIIVISLNVKNKSEEYKDLLVNRVSQLLGLRRYPWIIYSADEIDIILHIRLSNTHNRKNRVYYDTFSILYEGIFTLPSSKRSGCNFYCGIPIGKIRSINEVFLDSFIYMMKYHINFLIHADVFNKWMIVPGTAGDGLIGVELKKEDRSKSIPKQAFIDLIANKVAFEIEEDMWIEEGFLRGRAIVSDTDNMQWYLSKKGKRSLKKDQRNFNPTDDTSDRDNWDAMTDGMYGDYPEEGFDGDYESLGF